MIDFKSRIRNVWFWTGAISLFLLVLTSIGLKIDNEYIMNIVKAICALLTFVGVTVDTSTSGFSDK